MTDHDQLLALSYKAERAASRKLARDSGMTAEEALRATLAESAGSGGMDALVAIREAEHEAALERAILKARSQEAARAERAARHLGAPTAWQGWFDGSAHPNPGRCGIGAVLTGPQGRRSEISRAAGYGNSSEAEYMALIGLLEAAAGAGASELTIYGDSRVVIDDVNTRDEDAAPSLASLRSAARALMAKLGGVTLRWLPRHKNGEADALSQRAVAQSGEDPCDIP